MPQQRNTLQVGILTIVVVLVFFAVLMWISRGVGGDMQTITIHFKPAAAMPTIVPGSAVLVGGQTVGQVVEAALGLPEEAGDTQGGEHATPMVIVRAEISSALKLRADCTAFAEGPPLGGDGIIKIDLGVAPDPFVGGAIQGADPGGFSAILASLQSEFNANNPNSLLGQIKAQLDPEGEVSLMAKLHHSLGDINVMTASLSNQLGASDKATLLAKIHRIADSLNDMTADLRQEFDVQKPAVLLRKLHMAMDSLNDGLATVNRIAKASEDPLAKTMLNVQTTSDHIATQMDPARENSLMAQLRRTTTRINAALADINEVTGSTRDIVVLNRENINRLLMNFKEASDHIKTGVKYVLRNPWRLLNEPSSTETKQQAIFDAARSFTEAATRIDDASHQLRALSDLHDGAIPTEDADLAKILADLKRTHERYTQAEDELWRQLGVN